MTGGRELIQLERDLRKAKVNPRRPGNDAFAIQSPARRVSDQTDLLGRSQPYFLTSAGLRVVENGRRILFAEDSYTRIQGALKNLGHRVGRSTIARILKGHGLPPVPKRPTSWQTFLRAHWGAIAGADFFTTEVWTWRGLVTYYTVFAIDLASRRVQIVASTPYPNDLFMRQVCRALTVPDGPWSEHRVLICDRDRKWSQDGRQLFADAGVRVVQTPFQAPNANAHAERFVRSIKLECLDRIVPLGERHFRRTLTEFIDHYHREQNHQGLENQLIDSRALRRRERGIRRRQRLGGLLNYYGRAA